MPLTRWIDVLGGDRPPFTPHISAFLPNLNRHPAMRALVPGGYLFTHLMFWTVIGLVAVGTNAVAIILSVGLVLLALETIGRA